MRNALALFLAFGIAAGANAQLAAPAAVFTGQIELDEEQRHIFDITPYCFVDVDGDLAGTSDEEFDYGAIAPAGAGDNFATAAGVVGYGTNVGGDATCTISAEATLPAELDGELAFQIAMGNQAFEADEAAAGTNGTRATVTWGVGGIASGANEAIVTGVQQFVGGREAAFTIQVSDVALAGDDYQIDVLYTATIN